MTRRQEISMDTQLLTVQDVANILKVSRCTVYVLMRQGQFPAGLKIGHARRWRMSELQNFLGGGKVA